jgi:hypothetical protein
MQFKRTTAKWLSLATRLVSWMPQLQHLTMQTRPVIARKPLLAVLFKPYKLPVTHSLTSCELCRTRMLLLDLLPLRENLRLPFRLAFKTLAT